MVPGVFCFEDCILRSTDSDIGNQLRDVWLAAASQTPAIRWRHASKTGQAPSLQGEFVSNTGTGNLLSSAGAVEQPLGAGAGYVDHGLIGDDLSENRLNGRDLDQFVGTRQLFHTLELFVERELLVLASILQAMSEFERGREILHQAGQFLHGGVGGVVVGGLAAAARVSVAERLLSGKGEVLVMGVDVLLKIAGLRRQFEDFLPRFRSCSEV